jgi:hypothetical protein
VALAAVVFTAVVLAAAVGAAAARDGADRPLGHSASVSGWGSRELMPLTGVRVGAGTVVPDGTLTPVWAGSESGLVGVGASKRLLMENQARGA